MKEKMIKLYQLKHERSVDDYITDVIESNVKSDEHTASCEPRNGSLCDEYDMIKNKLIQQYIENHPEYDGKTVNDAIEYLVRTRNIIMDEKKINLEEFYREYFNIKPEDYDGIYDIIPYVITDDSNKLKAFKRDKFIEVNTHDDVIDYVIHLVGGITTFYSYSKTKGWDSHRDYIIDEINKLIEDGKKIKSIMML